MKKLLLSLVLSFMITNLHSEIIKRIAPIKRKRSNCSNFQNFTYGTNPRQIVELIASDDQYIYNIFQMKMESKSYIFSN